MKVEVVIYIYLSVCIAMIIFNIVSIFVLRGRDRRITEHSADFVEEIKKELGREQLSAEHKRYIGKKLKRIHNLMAFDDSLEILAQEDKEAVKRYLLKLEPVFIYLTMEYYHKNDMQRAFFPYLIKKYEIMKGRSIGIIIDVLKELVRSSNVYCRENALEALYTIGDAENVAQALCCLDESLGFFHPKMICDGLLNFTGDRRELDRKLEEMFERFTIKMQVTILDYFRFSSGEHDEIMINILGDEKRNDELRYSAIRYFARYPSEAARPLLLYFAERKSGNWQYEAIAATALGSYPGARTEECLKTLLTCSNWYVRYNAAESFEKLGKDYDELIDVFEGSDRYAREMLQYRFDRKKIDERRRQENE